MNCARFRDAIRAAGLTPPDAIEPGRFYRFNGEGKGRGNSAGWCKLFPDGLAGVFGDWSKGLSESWRAERDTPLTRSEREAQQRQIEEARAEADRLLRERQTEAATKAASIWAKGTAPANHPYLTAKHIKSHGTREYKGSLVVPLRIGSDLHSVQFILPNGDKRFLPGGRVVGCYFSIGNPSGADTLAICEGFATGASIYEATGLPVAVAFNAGNLLPVAIHMRDRFPTLRLVVCADDDWKTDGNPGITKATEAALSVGGLLAVPVFGDSRPERATDFNDMSAICGAEAVSRAIANAGGVDVGEYQVTSEKPTASEHAQSVGLIRASDVTPEPITWLWNGWLAAGKMHIFGGAPGTGKTTISMGLAATVTSGGRWPDGTRSLSGNVVIWSGEDDPSDVLVPRLMLSGADLGRVYFITEIREGNERRSFDPARDMDPLRHKLTEVGGVRLLIVDPIVSAIAGDSHKNAEVRRDLQPLVDLANSMRCALLGITHFSKGTSGREPVERLTGSLAFGALARVVLVAAKHQEEGEDGRIVRLFCRAKSNIGPDDGGFEYDLHQAALREHPDIIASSVLWGDAVEGAARDLLATADASGDDGEGAMLTDAKRFLGDLLSDGAMRAGDVFKNADQAGYSKSSIQRAANAIRVERHKDGMRGGWTWRLPLKVPRSSEDSEGASLSVLESSAPSAESSRVEIEL